MAGPGTKQGRLLLRAFVPDCCSQLTNVLCLLAKSCLILGDPMDYGPPGFSVHEILHGRILEWVAMPFSRGSSDPGIEPTSPALQVNSLPAEPPRKHKNTGVSNLSLLQGIFPTQELNRGLGHCRWILYQLSYQGSPTPTAWIQMTHVLAS